MVDSPRATTLEPAAAGAVLEAALKGLPPKAELTIADAAEKAGLALRDAERGLHHLSTKYRGTLSATEQGELLFRFPHGLSLPLAKRPWFRRVVDGVKGAVLGVARFVVRAWVSVVMIGYALVFLAIALALMFKDDSGDGIGAAFYVVLRVLMDALWWTFHPFSPIAIDRSSRRDRAAEQRRNRARGQRSMKRIKRFGEYVDVPDDDVDVEDDDTPFYEKVNRFVFGPAPEVKDPRVLQQRLITHIRNHAGRIGLLDVMRISGLPREEADPLMAQLLLDYDGDVDVSDAGAITYRFANLRKTAGHVDGVDPAPAWSETVTAPPVTGNSSGSNLLIGAVNAFNVVASFVALSMNLTVDRLIYMLQTAGMVPPAPPMPYDGVPWVLGVVPFLFSLALFALPAWRKLRQGKREAEAAAENARRAVLKVVSDKMEKAAQTGQAPVVHEGELKRAWAVAAGSVDDAELQRAIVELGGDIDLDDNEGSTRGAFRFRDLEAEVKELQRQREQASEKEAEVGAVVFRAE